MDPPGEALPDAVIITRFAHEMGWGAAFPSERAADIFDEFAALTASLLGFVVGSFFLSLAYSEMLYTLVALSVGVQKVSCELPS